MKGQSGGAISVQYLAKKPESSQRTLSSHLQCLHSLVVRPSS